MLGLATIGNVVIDLCWVEAHALRVAVVAVSGGACWRRALLRRLLCQGLLQVMLVDFKADALAVSCGHHVEGCC